MISAALSCLPWLQWQFGKTGFLEGTGGIQETCILVALSTGDTSTTLTTPLRWLSCAPPALYLRHGSQTQRGCTGTEVEWQGVCGIGAQTLDFLAPKLTTCFSG